MSQEMSDRVAIVTGAAGGIGRATALAFARQGARVAVTDIDLAGAEETAHRISQAGGDALAWRTDVTKPGDVAALVERTIGAFGRLDFAHNNAGVAHMGPDLTFTADYPEEEWDRIIAVNLKGVWLCLKHEIPAMLARADPQGGTHGGIHSSEQRGAQRGAIVNTASVLGLVGSKGHAAYVASKHGVAGLTKTAALEYARYGIRINAVCPGVIRTAMVESVAADPRLEEAYLRSQAIRRYGEPDEVANAVIWLCSDAASFVTGHMLSVDGGQVAQ